MACWHATEVGYSPVGTRLSASRFQLKAVQRHLQTLAPLRFQWDGGEACAGIQKELFQGGENTLYHYDGIKDLPV